MPGQANLYGVSNPLPYPVQSQASSGGSCPAGAETLVFAFPALVAPSGGAFYPVAFVNAILTIGATPPTNVLLSIRLSGGSDMFNLQVGNQFYVANQSQWIQACMPGTISNTAYQGTGGVIQFTCTPTGQAVTCLVAGFTSFCFLFRAPDQ